MEKRRSYKWPALTIQQKHDRVEYFESNKLFVDPDAKDNDLQLNSEFMYDSLHFNSKGYELWAKEIVKTLKPILDDRWWDHRCKARATLGDETV